MTWADNARILSRHPRATVFLALSSLLLASSLRATDRTLYGDAANYWQLAGTFVTNGRFAFGGYVDSLRGYSVPFLLFCVQGAARAIGVDAIPVFRTASALAGAATFAIVLPSFFTRLFGGGRLLPSMTFGVLCALYWRGHLLYPLSDFPALLLLTTGLLCLPSEGAPWRADVALVGGACIALAANARPINDAALLGSALLVCWRVAASRARRPALVRAAAFGLGVGLAAAPQALINARTLGTRNPFAHTRAGTAGENLYLQQLMWGISIQRYETNIGGTFPVAAIFADRSGQQIMGLKRRSDPRYSAHEAQASLGRYLRLVVARPLFFASAYGRHLFNGLDVAYPTPYVTRLVPRSAPFALVNYVILGLAAVYGLYLIPQLRWREHRWRLAVVTVFILPALASIPTAIECRFLLPLWTLSYGFVFSLLEGGSEAASLRPRYLLVAVVVGVLAAFALASATFAQIQHGPPSFDIWCLWCPA